MKEIVTHNSTAAYVVAGDMAFILFIKPNAPLFNFKVRSKEELENNRSSAYPYLA